MFDQTLKKSQDADLTPDSEGEISSIDNPRYTIFDGPTDYQRGFGWIIKPVFGPGMLGKVYLRLG